MNRHLIVFLGAIAIVSMIGCKREMVTNPEAKETTNAAAVQKAVVGGSNSFGFSLFAAVCAADTGKNVFVSPLSVSMALGMTLNGANGATKDAMATTLGFSGLSDDAINQTYYNLNALLTTADPRVTLNIANSIWYRPELPVLQSFKTVNTTFFNAEITPIDFSSASAAGTINDWVSAKTNGRITSIIDPPIPPEEVMYLINAVYFKGTWKYQFDSTQTRDALFTPDGASRVTCRMMGTQDTIPYFSSGGVSGIDLPYGSNMFSMTVILPPYGTTVKAFVASLTQEAWEHYVSLLTVQPVVVYLPKFTLEYKKILNNQLSSLGMAVAFSGQADFSRIAGSGGLAIDKVIHKTFLQVDEEGTEAAGVTSVGMYITSAGSDEFPPTFRADRPFVIVIREKTSGTILFIGKVENPV